MNIKKALFSQFSCPYSVSYTHLDVYKRQVLRRPVFRQGEGGGVAADARDIRHARDAEVTQLLLGDREFVPRTKGGIRKVESRLFGRCV